MWRTRMTYSLGMPVSESALGVVHPEGSTEDPTLVQLQIPPGVGLFVRGQAKLV